MPNDIKDVTRAIADQYGRGAAKSYLAGRAFTAPREHAAQKTLAKPLVPKQAALQPRRSSMRRQPDEQAELDRARRLARVNSTVGRSGSSRRPTKTTGEMLRELEELKE